MKDKSGQNICTRMQRFADVTKSLIMQGNIERAVRCLKIAEEIFNTGTSETRNAITNVYLFSVSTFIEVHNCSIRNLFPVALRSEYYKQVNTSGL